ncbi:NEW3 domain-containing protein [Candidatus Aenigmatarchaeota archaeon]
MKGGTAILLAVIILVLAIFLIYTVSAFSGFGQPQNDTWYNISWQYRFGLDINSTQVDRTDWPIEYTVNFTDILPSGTFDNNSVRVMEHNNNGEILHEVTSQFDIDDTYDASSNALGTVIFIMNGTSPGNTTRKFYVYYDTVENGAKSSPGYSTNIVYGKDDENKTINVNNTILRIYLDTNKGENTSGIQRLEDSYQNVILYTNVGDRTSEYVEYYNGTHNTTYNLINNITVVTGPVRLTIIQEGPEVEFGNISAETGEATIKKKYHIYDTAGPQSKGSFIKISQEIENIAGYSITRNSTPAGALAYDLERTFGSGSGINGFVGDFTEPYSWIYADDGTQNFVVGLINLNTTSNYYVYNATGRLGIHLNSTSISSGEKISEKSLTYFGTGGSDGVTEFLNIKAGITNELNFTQYAPEYWYVNTTPEINITIFNRNETIIIQGNVSEGDPYSLTRFMNVTINNGTDGTGDDTVLFLYDDGTNGDATSGDKIYTNTFIIPKDANITEWLFNFSTYEINESFLSYDEFYFNVTDVYSVNTDIINQYGLVNRQVVSNVYVRNFRNDSFINSTYLNCTADGEIVSNITNYNNGTYIINFTAPSYMGEFPLFCNATGAGNIGNFTQNYFTEAGKTILNLTPDRQTINVSNIGIYQNDTSEIMLNITNTGNGTAYNTTIFIEILSNWGVNTTTQSCENILNSSACYALFNVTIPNNTAPGTYPINFTVNWTNPDQTNETNTTQVNISVLPNPVINLTSNMLLANASDGRNWTLGNFQIFSVGNEILENITINCSSGTVCQQFNPIFIPANISMLGIGNNTTVYVNLSVPINYTPGTYNGTVNISTLNRSFILTLRATVSSNTTMNITFNPENYTSSNITISNNETFTIIVNSTNAGYGSARDTNISIASMPGNWSSNISIQYCQNITTYGYCERTFYFTIPNSTSPGNFTINFTAEWKNNDNSTTNTTQVFNVTVAPNPEINLSESSIVGNVSAGENGTIGNFTIYSIGNGNVEDITMVCDSGEVCENFSVTFIPSSITNITQGGNQTVLVNVSVPASYAAGTYNGTINVSGTLTDVKQLLINVTVLSNRIWTMTPTSCTRSEFPDEGLVCEVNISNVGNTFINFTITPETGNKSYANMTNFTIDTQENMTFSVLYNVTNSTQQIYNTTFTITSVQEASPQQNYLVITLLPYVPPVIDLEINPNSTEQSSQIQIYANVTDASNTNISGVMLNITRPDGTLDSANMSRLSVSGNFSRWYVAYPNSTGFGNTSQRGNYNLSIVAADNVGNAREEQRNITVYLNMIITSSTLSSLYYQGDTGSIFYRAVNISGLGISGMNVTFKIYDNNQNMSYQDTYQTNDEGNVFPMPTFTISSDAPVGNYSLVTNSTYFDTAMNTTINKTTNSSFVVEESTVTVAGLFADIETAVVWYPDNVMRFAIFTYDGQGTPVNPTVMELNVLDPALNDYFTVNLGNMTQQGTGYYLYSYAMPASTATGMYLAILNVTYGNLNTMKIQAFRVAQGGPYDIRIETDESEVIQGGTLDFDIFIENMGEVSQDVYLNYWISSEDQSTNYTGNTEWVYTPALYNQSFSRDLDILSDQMLGTYRLNILMTYDPVQPPLSASTTFFVVASVEEPEEPTTPPSSSGTTSRVTAYTTFTEYPDKLGSAMLVSRYDSRVKLARGANIIKSVVVENIGTTDLVNIEFVVLGIDTSWYTIKPEIYGSLSEGDSTTFIIEFDVPEDAETGTYQATYLVSSSTTSHQVGIIVEIVDSVEDLIELELEDIKRELKVLERDTDNAEKQGKNVDNIRKMIFEIKRYITSAESNLEQGRPEDALDDIENARNLIQRAREMLAALEIEFEAEEFPLFFIITIFVIITVLVTTTLNFVLRKKQGPISPHMKAHFDKIREKMSGPAVDKNELAAEKEKLMRMLNVLEKEKTEGIVSSSAYKEMRKGIDDKLHRINKKLK